MSAFFTLHADLPREGPGLSEEVAWAAALAGVRADARICDAGCGPGGDVAALLAAAPEGRVTAIDAHAPFVARIPAHPRVRAQVGDMSAIAGPYDFIWCAGAMYFIGVTEALTLWRAALAPGGAVAFSEPCLFRDTPGARALWEGYPATDADGIAARVAAAGYRTLGTRRLNAAAWEAYYAPMADRIAALRPGADAALSAVLDEGEAEIAAWRAHGADTGYLLSVVVPA